jgi:hypothetical protein
MRTFDRRHGVLGLAMLAAFALQSQSSHAAIGGQDLEITHIQEGGQANGLAS